MRSISCSHINRPCLQDKNTKHAYIPSRRLVPHLKHRIKLTRSQSTSASQVATQTVTRFSRNDAESVHKSLETLTQAILQDPVTQYLSPGDKPLKEVNQEPAAMSDSTVKDKFTELSKAMSEQLVDFLMAHGTCIKVSFIGTQPEKQGQGLGGQLIRAINKVADAEQQWVYLEASSERGTHLYLRNGFQIVKETKLQPDAPTIYCMGRPPKPDVPSDV
ncbi:hypothetical protein WJX82_007048 [Trebouxia sp. C0006]